MLEHRRLQAQLAQLQRYRESALAHVDAVSNHKINQTFLRAIQGTVINADVSAVVEDLQESISSVREMSELLGQPLTTGVEEVVDFLLMHSRFACNPGLGRRLTTTWSKNSWSSPRLRPSPR
jgi:hypothetical protein